MELGKIIDTPVKDLMGANAYSKELDKALVVLIEGLQTDGAHHKQWAMERALAFICGDDWLEKARAEFQWEEGITP